MRVKYFIAALVLLAVGLLPAPAHAGGVVTVCDEAHLLAALAGGGTVTFACSGVITLTAEIVIARDTTIDGSGQEVTISGDDAVRVFHIAERVTVSLNALTVADGSSLAYPGGGIYNLGALTVSNSTFSGNSALHSGGGIYNGPGAVLAVSNSTFSGNSAQQGGGIGNNGTLTVSDSLFSGNHAEHGGGLHSSTDDLPWPLLLVEVSNSTFADNSADHAGGGICSYATRLAVNDSAFTGNDADRGGGIFNHYGELIVTGSTFDNNDAQRWGGGIYCGYRCLTAMSNSTLVSNTAREGGGAFGGDGATMHMSNCTMAGNSAANQGGGVYGDHSLFGATALRNTIVADSPSGGNCQGDISDGGGNLSFPDTTCPGINANPLLDPLRDNGGPTWTMALGPGSAAIDAADDATCAADPVNNRDQRGVIRPQGAHCDIGAFELPGRWLPIVLVE
jgi:hypothetical protein